MLGSGHTQEEQNNRNYSQYVQWNVNNQYQNPPQDQLDLHQSDHANISIQGAIFPYLQIRISKIQNLCATIKDLVHQCSIVANQNNPIVLPPMVIYTSSKMEFSRGRDMFWTKMSMLLLVFHKHSLTISKPYKAEIGQEHDEEFSSLFLVGAARVYVKIQNSHLLHKRQPNIRNLQLGQM